MLAKLAEVRKAVAAAVGGALTVLVFVSDNLGGVLPAEWTAVLGVAIAVLTVVATWAVPNEPSTPDA